MEKQETNSQQNFTFSDLNENTRTFEEESEDYSGKDVRLNFLIKGHEELKISENFKGGQDFEYVKYKLSTLLNTQPEDMTLYLNGKQIIPLFSICDIEIAEDDIIIVEITETPEEN